MVVGLRLAGGVEVVAAHTAAVEFKFECVCSVTHRKIESVRK